MYYIGPPSKLSDVYDSLAPEEDYAERKAAFMRAYADLRTFTTLTRKPMLRVIHTAEKEARTAGFPVPGASGSLDPLPRPVEPSRPVSGPILRVIIGRNK